MEKNEAFTTGRDNIKDRLPLCHPARPPPNGKGDRPLRVLRLSQRRDQRADLFFLLMDNDDTNYSPCMDGT
jgi:hypothetical protein